jgi:hypothetical protein
MIISMCRETIQSPMEPINHKKNLRDNDDIRFFTEVHLLAGKLVLVMAIHSPRGSHTNWHHTLNP